MRLPPDARLERVRVSRVLAVLAATLLVAGTVGAAPVAALGSGGVGPAGTAAVAGSAQVDEPVEPCEFPVTLTDATGTEVTIEEKPERVTTLGPSAAQTMWEIGGKQQVVGLSQYALYLDGAAERTNVSAAGFGYDVEKVVGTEPDLVLAANITPAETVEKLRQAGLTVFVLEKATSIEDVGTKTTKIGRLTGNCIGAAETNKWMMANVETAREVTADRERVRAMYPLGGGFVAADNTFITDIIEASGGTNVAAANYTGYPKLSDEVVVDLDPEFLVLTPYTTYLTGSEPYASTTAVEQNNTLLVPSRILSQPAPRSVVYAVQNLTRAFHPEASEEAAWTARDEVSVQTPTPTPTPTPTQTIAKTESVTPAQTTTETTGPGFGPAAAVASLAAIAVLAIRRRRN